MGTGSIIEFLEKLGLISTHDGSRRPLRLGLDVPLLLASITLVVFGLLMVYSASWDFAWQIRGDPTYTFKRQLLWLVLGSIIAVFLAWFNYRFLRRLVIPAMFFTILALVAVLIIGDERLGASRGLLGGSIQPSELAKLVVIIYLAVWLDNRRERIQDVSFGLVPLGVILGILGGLILLQPDLSAVLTIFLLGGMMFFLAGGDLKQIAVLLIFGLLAVFIIYVSSAFPTAKERIDTFLAGLQDLMKSSDHVKRSIEAFTKGGWFGVGIGKSETKLLGLPFPHTDSIFAVVGEETGVFGSVTLVLLYMVVMWRGLVIAQNAPDRLGRILAGGLTFWLMSEATINMAVMLGLMPFAGNALPFISAGGSSLVVCLAAVGILTNIARQSVVLKEREERTFGAVVDLRRGDRRRRVSGPVRPAGPERR